MAHGGILAAILDETMGRTLLADERADSVEQARFMFTAKMEIRYRRPVLLNEEFTVRRRVEQDRGRTALVSGEIALADGSMAVEASATLVDIPHEHLRRMLGADVGWRVYPQEDG